MWQSFQEINIELGDVKGKLHDFDLLKVLKGSSEGNSGSKMDINVLNTLEEKFFKKLQQTDKEMKLISDSLYNIKNDISTVKLYGQESKTKINECFEQNRVIGLKFEAQKNKFEKLKAKISTEVNDKLRSIEESFEAKVAELTTGHQSTKVEVKEQPAGVVESMEALEGEVTLTNKKVGEIEVMLLGLVRRINLEKIETELEGVKEKMTHKTDVNDHEYTKEKIVELDTAIRVLRDELKESTEGRFSDDLLAMNKKIDVLNSKLNHMYNNEIAESQVKKKQPTAILDTSKFVNNAEVAKLTEQLIKDRKYYDGLLTDVGLKLDGIRDDMSLLATIEEMKSVQSRYIKRLLGLQVGRV